jgi:hypothetical protein
MVNNVVEAATVGKNAAFSSAGALLSRCSNEALPHALPSFHGRMMFDFVVPDSDSVLLPPSTGKVAAVAPVPEAETYALLRAGLGILGFAPRRKTRTA